MLAVMDLYESDLTLCPVVDVNLLPLEFVKRLRFAFFGRVTYGENADYRPRSMFRNCYTCPTLCR